MEWNGMDADGSLAKGAISEMLLKSLVTVFGFQQSRNNYQSDRAEANTNL